MFLNRQIFFKTDEEIALMRESNLIVSKTLAYAATLLKPGVTGKFINAAAETFIRDHGGKPAFKGYRGFPASLCISYNDIVVHGIPSDREFVEGDIVSIDCGVELNGFFGDAAFTFAMVGAEEPVMELLRVTYRALLLAIDKAVEGNRIGDISHAVQRYCEKEHGYGVVRELVGHGIGRSLHEQPDVPNYGYAGKGILLKEGLTIAIEPMVNLGKREVFQARDGWTIHSKDRKPSAHFEHSVAVRKKKAEVLSNHSFLHESIKNNEFLLEVSPKS